ncbi:tetratricopeptide repeat protein [Amycolatopsis sp.]|uniref:tetratricopeptide repeat protein n=1 Tax=Amycolatopsis sp. TaxID=37632 RepID=UPI002E042895|nr:tetratricopeptide repeat protein [Amycolatopsis sp.]
MRQVKKIREVIGTDRAVAVAQRRIGEMLADQQQYSAAIAAMRGAADMMVSLDRAQYARVLTSLAAVYLRCGRADDAGPLLTEALDITREIGSTHDQAEVLVVLGDVARHRTTPTKHTSTGPPPTRTTLPAVTRRQQTSRIASNGSRPGHINPRGPRLRPRRVGSGHRAQRAVRFDMRERNPVAPRNPSSAPIRTACSHRRPRRRCAFLGDHARSPR